MARYELEPHVRSNFLVKMDAALFGKARRAQYEDLVRIIYDNSSYYGNTQKQCSFRGTVYSSGPLEKPRRGEPKQPVNLLNRLYRDRLKSWISVKEELETESNLTLGYIKIMMLETTYAADFYKLLPEALHHVIDKMDRHFSVGLGKMDEDAIKVFNEKNDRYIRLLKVRMVRNLIDIRSN